LSESVGSGENGHRGGHVVDFPAADVVELEKEDPPHGKKDEVVRNHQGRFEEKGSAEADRGADAGGEEVEEEGEGFQVSLLQG